MESDGTCRDLDEISYANTEHKSVPSVACGLPGGEQEQA